MEAWTDERLDDLAASLRPLPTEMARVSQELAVLSAQTAANTDELRAIRTDLSALHRLVAQVGWGMALAVVGAQVGLLITLA